MTLASYSEFVLVMLRTQSGIGLTDLPIVYWGGCPLAPPRSDGPVRGSNFLNLRFAYKLSNIFFHLLVDCLNRTCRISWPYSLE